MTRHEQAKQTVRYISHAYQEVKRLISRQQFGHLVMRYRKGRRVGYYVNPQVKALARRTAAEIEEQHRLEARGCWLCEHLLHERHPSTTTYHGVPVCLDWVTWFHDAEALPLRPWDARIEANDGETS